ncbi:2OG-Fe(II) oxygenase family protein [Kordiimonas aestuarii]|uniref:2OG-Fe(II) oxygenase family protein n=1 Tax=Kordiimonas aestuarii TaxID=1005925 RepID=UPI0021CFB663|nr:2OG-Fe(II) oxygenase [Kordiimonas aestuarii]
MSDALSEFATKVIPRDDSISVCFGVTSRASDREDTTVLSRFHRSRVFLDADWAIARKYGLVADNNEDGRAAFKPTWFVLDPTLRVYARGTIAEIDRLAALVQQLPHPSRHAGGVQEAWAPVLLVPRVLPPSLCKALIDYYNQHDAYESGFMRAEGDKTVGVNDTSFKRRQDVNIDSEELRTALRVSVSRRLLPELKRAFQYDATRVERYIVACYDSKTQGFFRAHRDNTTPGTAHRRFAVTINLNAEGFEGGELRFPEYGSRTYKAPTGGAVVFSCSLLHEALPVTSGVRYATLPFLYGTQDAETRLRSSSSVVDAERITTSKVT